MAKYTVELAEMFASFVKTIPVFENEQKLWIHKLGKYFTITDFNYFKNTNLNTQIDSFGPAFIKYEVGNVAFNVSDCCDLNDAILAQFYRTFVRHFYTYEIGQENPLAWSVLLRGFFDTYLPIFALEYQQLIVKNQAFITNLNRSATASGAQTTNNSTANQNSNTKAHSSSVNASADTPQNELNFKIATGDPTEDYNFKYASDVNGAKGNNDQTEKSDQKSDSISKTKSHSHTNTSGRNENIMSLISQLETFTNGLYIQLFDRAMNYGLFMEVF